MSSASNSSVFKASFVDGLIEVDVMVDQAQTLTSCRSDYWKRSKRNALHTDHITSSCPNLSRGNRRSMLHMSL